MIDRRIGTEEFESHPSVGASVSNILRVPPSRLFDFDLVLCVQARVDQFDGQWLAESLGGNFGPDLAEAVDNDLIVPSLVQDKREDGALIVFLEQHVHHVGSSKVAISFQNLTQVLGFLLSGLAGVIHGLHVAHLVALPHHGFLPEENQAHHDDRDHG